MEEVGEDGTLTEKKKGIGRGRVLVSYAGFIGESLPYRC
jgi:hypothetical protein